MSESNEGTRGPAPPPQHAPNEPASSEDRRAVVVLGAGAIGTALARQWAERGRTVHLVSRHGGGPRRDDVALHAQDARDAEAIAHLADGTAAIVNCASPAYHRWPEEWPSFAAALIEAAERADVPLVNLSNLYAYAPSGSPFRPNDEPAPPSAKAAARAEAWRAMREAHDAGRIRAAEVRASDFVGPGTQSHLGDRVVPRLLAGKPVRVIGDPDAPHAWCFSDDVARTLRAVADRRDAFGRVWHAPVAATRSQREAIDDMAEAAAVEPVAVGRVARWMLWLAGLGNRDARELRHVLYQFERPFLVDDAETRARLGVEPTPWDEVLRATVAAYRGSTESTAP